MASPAQPTAGLFAFLRGFSVVWLAGDAVAALTLAATAIPEQLATARLLGMPPMSGLFAFVPARPWPGTVLARRHPS